MRDGRVPRQVDVPAGVVREERVGGQHLRALAVLEDDHDHVVEPRDGPARRSAREGERGHRERDRLHPCSLTEPTWAGRRAGILRALPS